jgi:hypothetical protein
MSQPINSETLLLAKEKGFESIFNILQPQSDVQKWLRDRGIHIEPQFSRNADDSGYEWWFYLYPRLGGGRIKFFTHEIGEGLDYEGALEIGLQEGLKLVK